MPKFELESVTDYYTFYVLILGISESLFWDMPISKLFEIEINLTSYRGWKAYIENEQAKAR